jgi:hypothetical protein
MLLLQKTIAWCDRHAERDLADIACLALADQVEKGDLTAQLERLVATLPAEYSRMMHKVAARFRDGDQVDGIVRSMSASTRRSLRDCTSAGSVCNAAMCASACRRVLGVAIKRIPRSPRPAPPPRRSRRRLRDRHLRLDGVVTFECRDDRERALLMFASAHLTVSEHSPCRPHRTLDCPIAGRRRAR